VQPVWDRHALPTEIILSDLVRLARGRKRRYFALDNRRALRLAFGDTQQDDVNPEAVVLEAAHAAGASAPAAHDVARWTPVLAAARLGEDIKQERSRMLALARENA
jgi:hypothetical protein